jgi:hypothetical protein
VIFAMKLDLRLADVGVSVADIEGLLLVPSVMLVSTGLVTVTWTWTRRLE